MILHVYTYLGFVCNAQCSGDLRVGELTSNNWHLGVKLFIAVLVVGLAVACIALKIVFIYWLYILKKKQDQYLDSLKKEENEASLNFPLCDENDAVSVSCLDLCYSVKFGSKKMLNDERKDETAPIVLTDIPVYVADQDQDNRELAFLQLYQLSVVHTCMQEFFLGIFQGGGGGGGD